MTMVRPPAVAGAFYPGDPEALEATVRRHLSEALEEASPHEESPAKALIVPHAGYRYSGPVAASAYRQLEPRHASIRRVVILGPSHRVALRGLGATSADSFATPLGEVRVDREAVELCLALPQVRINDDAHALEHSLEVHLPFLQCVLDDFSIVPFSVGDATPAEVDEVLELLWGGDETVILVSSDLSHYYAYQTAQQMDAQTTRAIEALDPDGIGYEGACGRIPARGLLAAARRHGLEARTLDVRNSGDTAGGLDQVVGYGSYAFEPAGAAPRNVYNARERAMMLAVARESLESGLRDGHGAIVSVPGFPPKLRESRACFVTLEREGKLRGCIGSLEAFRPLIVDVADRAYAAGFGDPRFEPLRREELEDLTIKISVLSPLEPFPVDDEDDLVARVRPGVDGLVVQEGARRGTLLPSVWESLSDPRTFVRHVKLKAGLPEDYWSPSIAWSRFTSENVA